MSSDLRKAAEAAIDALEYHTNQTKPLWKTEKVLMQLRSALAQHDVTPSPVPVAWMRFQWIENEDGLWDSQTTYNEDGDGVPLFTHPPRREWQGLTDDERHDVFRRCFDEDDVTHDDGVLISAIESALKEKNCG